jgi:hypothetical protein
MKIGEWTEIFRAGDYGARGRYSEGDLDGIIANFNATDQVPIVVGHPQMDSPAWGWLAELKRSGSVLLGKIGELHKDFAEAIAEGKFKNRSVRIARTAAGPKLMHLGFLGAALPRVEGLKQTAQFAGDGDCVDYGFELPGGAGQGDNSKEIAMTEEEIKKLQDDLKATQDELAAEKAARQKDKEDADKAAGEAKAAEFANFVETEMVATGKLAVARKDEVVEFMKTLPDGEAADFSFAEDGATRTVKPVAWFKDFVKSLPSADFTRDLPQGAPAAGKQESKLTDLSHKV